MKFLLLSFMDENGLGFFFLLIFNYSLYSSNCLKNEKLEQGFCEIERQLNGKMFF